MSVREWPWWRLYVKVAPLLNVHRTEDQLKARTVRNSYIYISICVLHSLYTRAIIYCFLMHFFIPIGRARASQGKSGALGAGTQSSETRQR